MLKWLPYYIALCRTINLTRIGNLVLVECSYLISLISRKVVVAGQPWAASVEPTTSCNLRCPECPTGMHQLSRPKGSLDFRNFEKILSALSSKLIHLTLYFQGEPFLNKDVFAMIKLAVSRKIFVATSTNAHFLSDANVCSIISSGLNHLIISMDGLDQQVYEKYRVGGDLSKVTEGIHRLVLARKAANVSHPFIELQFLVFRHNEHQMREMRVFAKETGVDVLSFKPAQLNNYDTGRNLLPLSARYSRYTLNPNGSIYLKKKIRNRCHRIWSSVVVTWQGETVPCCYDKDADFVTGDLTIEALDKIWENEKYTSFRKNILQKRNEIPMCCNCGE